MEIKVPQDQQITLEEKKISLVNKFLSFFAAPPDVAPITDTAVIKKTYTDWRIRIFYSAFIGYVTFYLLKKNIAAALPGIQEEFHYSKTQLGLIGSSLYFTYMIGKFVNGIIADKANVRTFLPTALIISALANICFVLSSIFITPGEFTFLGMPSAAVLIWVMAFFWGCNGWFQSGGFPPIAKSMTFWFSNNERGLKWSLWSTSHQVGTSLSFFIMGALAAHFGWKIAFIAPAIFAILVSMFLFDRMRDKPTTLGLPDVEHYREPERQTCKPGEKGPDDDLTHIEIFKKYILCNTTLWLLAVAYIFVYIIRFGTEDWVVLYLTEAKKNSIQLATAKTGFLPLFGILGTIGAGYLSDKIFKGQRTPINVIFLIGVIISILLFKYNHIPTLDFLFLGLIGMFTYGPQVLIGGVCAVEAGSKRVAAAATGLTGLFGYIGAVFSGVGTGVIIDKFGWNGALYFWIFAAVMCILLCLPLWNNKGSCK